MDVHQFKIHINAKTQGFPRKHFPEHHFPLYFRFFLNPFTGANCNEVLISPVSSFDVADRRKCNGQYSAMGVSWIHLKLLLEPLSEVSKMCSTAFENSVMFMIHIFIYSE